MRTMINKRLENNYEHEEEVRVQILSKRTMKRWGKNYHVLLLVQLQY